MRRTGPPALDGSPLAHRHSAGDGGDRGGAGRLPFRCFRARRRAGLVALGEAIQQQCPCRESERPRRRARVLYEDCGRNVVRQAVLAGDLRRDCLSHRLRARLPHQLRDRTGARADTTIRRGRIRCAAASRRAAQCDDRGTAIETVCVDETNCSDVVDWTAATCIDPRLRGPYEAGARLMTVTKKSASTATRIAFSSWSSGIPPFPARPPSTRLSTPFPTRRWRSDGAPYPIADVLARIVRLSAAVAVSHRAARDLRLRRRRAAASRQHDQ